MSFATAWATSGTDVFDLIRKKKKKIDSAVIGTHFYQTHPDVLDTFVGSDKVKFVLQPKGVFHPKAYAFWKGEEWEVLIGSANLTAGALTRNSELCVLITNIDGKPNLLEEVRAVIETYSANARTITKEEANRYRRLWRLKVPALDRLAGQYGSDEPRKSPVDSPVMSMAWADFFLRVKQDKTHGFEDRVAMLESVRRHFARHDHFNDMDFDVRCGIAGLPSEAIAHWGWFGSMKGAGTFWHLINEETPAFSLALDCIPLNGAVTKEHFDDFIRNYLKAFPEGRDGVGTATRLLAMKRPDTFVCVDAANKRLLAKDMGIGRADRLTYERYWEEVVLRIQDAPWWLAPQPRDPKERAVWLGRAAMLDAIFYEQS